MVGLWTLLLDYLSHPLPYIPVLIPVRQPWDELTDTATVENDASDSRVGSPSVSRHCPRGKKRFCGCRGYVTIDVSTTEVLGL